MGYTTRGSITDFWPDDTEDTLYLTDGYSLQDIIEKAKEKWPDASFDNISLSPEHIHTSCLYYDRYDGNDYTTFTVITKVK